jgi:hypothetical protein
MDATPHSHLPVLHHGCAPPVLHCKVPDCPNADTAQKNPLPRHLVNGKVIPAYALAISTYVVCAHSPASCENCRKGHPPVVISNERLGHPPVVISNERFEVSFQWQFQCVLTCRKPACHHPDFLRTLHVTARR